MLKLSRTAVATAGLWIAFVAACSQPGRRTNHVIIAYPENWKDGDRRPCFLGPAGGHTVSRAAVQPDLLQLDCDRFVDGEVIHRTPQERIYALDVRFLGDTNKPDETAWTCESKNASVECRQ